MLFINPLNFYIMEFSKVQVLKSVYLFKASKWQYMEQDIFTLSKEEYKRFTSRETLQWFRNLGSKQVPINGCTSFGNLCVKLSSFSPDGEEKHVYQFRIIQ